MRLSRFLKNPIFLLGAILALANFVLYREFYLHKLVPFPGDLLVAFFFPWNGGGFSGFNPWTVYKEWNAADAIRQIYPWKSLVVSQLLSFQWPLWNPYNFSGTPLLANLQSSVFFPGSLLLLLSLKWGWVVQVIGLLPLFGLFCYLYLRSEKLDNLPAIFGSVVLSSLSYLLVWQEILVITQAVLFLPLILWLINTRRSIFIASFLLALSFFGGHIQTTAYVYIITFIYLVYKRTPVFKIFLCMFLPILIAAIQLVPSIEAYLLSARDGQMSKELFPTFILPWKYLITAIAPDFFGNPATRNFFGEHYGERQVFFGVTALFFAWVSIISNFSSTKVKVFLFMAVAGILLATSPGAYLFEVFNIPILGTSMPARTIFLFQFAGGVLAAMGVNYWLTKNIKFKFKDLIPVVVMALLYFILWAGLILNKGEHFIVSRNNLILPTITILITSLIYFLGLLRGRYKKILVFGILVLSIFEYGYFFNKYSPFSKDYYVFPDHPVLTFLQKNAGENRFFGDGSSRLDKNFATYYKIYSSEGYDPIYIRRYGEFISTSKNGEVANKLPRSDADIYNSANSYRDRLLNILGTKYVLNKSDQPKSEWDPDLSIFPQTDYTMLWQKNKWQIFRRNNALPRAVMFSDYEVSPQESLIERFYSNNFDYKKVVLLEKDPGFEKVVNQSTPSANIVSYTPNKVIIKTNAQSPNLLFLSDAYYPGWKAFVDGNEREVLRADYAFRAVAVPKGDHEVTFVYDPWTFKLGAVITVLSLSIGYILVRKRCF